jgi:Protein of unknown function (DUF2934)
MIHDSRSQEMKTLWGAKELTVNKKPRQEARASLQEQIQRRAYELYEAKGRNNGRELEDWLQAELELTTKATAA